MTASYFRFSFYMLITLSTALAVACRDVDVRNVKAIIIGPSDSPYEFGFFEVGKSPYGRYKQLIYFQFAVKFGKGIVGPSTKSRVNTN
jgi:hypothetical protein